MSVYGRRYSLVIGSVLERSSRVPPSLARKGSPTPSVSGPSSLLLPRALDEHLHHPLDLPGVWPRLSRSDFLPCSSPSPDCLDSVHPLSPGPRLRVRLEESRAPGRTESSQPPGLGDVKIVRESTTTTRPNPWCETRRSHTRLYSLTDPNLNLDRGQQTRSPVHYWRRRTDSRE